MSDFRGKFLNEVIIAGYDGRSGPLDCSPNNSLTSLVIECVDKLNREALYPRYGSKLVRKDE